MGSMRFMSCPRGNNPVKYVVFDSSPGRAIARKLGGLDEKSYHSELKESRLDGSELVYEISMRRESTRTSPGPHPLEKVGMLTYRKPNF